MVCLPFGAEFLYPVRGHEKNVALEVGQHLDGIAGCGFLPGAVKHIEFKVKPLGRTPVQCCLDGNLITVVEAPSSDERSYAVIAEIKRVIPGKPIRYLVTTHHHFDHISGIRNYVAEGATIVTHELNEEFFNDGRVRTGWTLLNAYTEVFKGVNALTLPNRTIKLHRMLDVLCNGSEMSLEDVSTPEPDAVAEDYTITERLRNWRGLN